MKINLTKLKREFPYEIYILFINTVMIVDLLRMIVPSAGVLGIVRNGLYLLSLIYMFYHAIHHRHSTIIVMLGTYYVFLAALSCLQNVGLFRVILSESLIFLSRCVVGFYFAYYIPVNDIFLKKIKKYFVILIIYCVLYMSTHTLGLYATDGSYMTFSYNILIMVMLWILLTVYNPTILRVIGTIAFVCIIVVYGARGPLLCIAVSFGLFLLYKFADSSVWKKILQIILCVVGSFSIVSAKNIILDFLLTLNPESRTLYLLKNSNLDALSGRDIYYEVLKNKINQNWILPHGIYSDRLALASGSSTSSNLDLSAFYAHNLPMEIMYQFGAVFGCILLLLLLFKVVSSYHLLFKLKDYKYAIVYCAFFTGITTLFFSSSYLINERFWLALGLIFGIRQRVLFKENTDRLDVKKTDS